MHIIDLLLFLVTGSAVVLAVVVWRRRQKHLVNIAFSLFTLSAGLWAFSIALFRLSQTAEIALYSQRMIYIMASIVACTFLYFAKEYPFVRKPFYKEFRYIILVPFISTLVLLFTPWFIAGVKIAPAGNNTAQLGPAFAVWALWALSYMVWGLVELFIKYRLANSLHKMQMRYIFVAVTLPLVCAIPFAIILPWQGNFELLWIAAVSLLPMLLLITYAIGRYRLIDIRIFLNYTLTYVLSSFVLIAAGLLLFLILNHYFLHLEPNDAGVITVLVIFSLGLAAFNPVLTIIQNFLNRYLFRTLYSHQTALRKLSRDITTIIDFNELVNSIVHTVMESIGLNKAAIILLDDKLSKRLHPITIVGFTNSIAHTFMRDNALVDWCTEHSRPLAFEDIEHRLQTPLSDHEQSRLLLLQQMMFNNKVGACLPLFYQNNLYGVILLGRKLNGDIYTSDDLTLLETVANQTTVAIEHARVYRDIQTIVDQQTAEITRKNADLEELLEIKSDFLTIASHQLRTPMTAIRGFLSFLVEEDLPAEEKIHFAKQAYASANRMELVINDILTATELEGHELQVKAEDTNLETIIHDAIAQAKPLMGDKKIQIEFKKKVDFPDLFTDGRKLRECVHNLLENAIEYTEEGKIVVILDRFRKFARITVKDPGVGFTKIEAHDFGEKFYRAERVRRVVADGSGLGLFITNTYMGMLQGKLVFTSKGKNQGAAFSLLVPNYIPVIKAESKAA